jgi:hypothetical protein
MPSTTAPCFRLGGQDQIGGRRLEVGPLSHESIASV